MWFGNIEEKYPGEKHLWGGGFLCLSDSFRKTVGFIFLFLRLHLCLGGPSPIVSIYHPWPATCQLVKEWDVQVYLRHHWAEAERENSLGGNIMFAVNHLATFPKRKVSEGDCRSGWWVPLGSQSAMNSPGEHSNKFVKGFQSRSSDIWEVRELPRINRTRFRKKLLIHSRQEGHCLKEPVSFSDVQTGG